MRALTAEIAQARGKVWAQLMWDIEAFYNSMQMRQTLESLRRLEAPTRVAAMALMVHKGPRWLRSGESFASPVLGTARSVLAGCPTSTSLARAYMHSTAACTAGTEGTATNQHVDDLSHCLQAENAEQMRRRAKEVATAVAEQISAARLKIANKRGGAKVAASLPRLAAAIATDLRAPGLPFRAASEMEDLGVGSKDAGARRNRRTIKARTAKAKGRASAVRTLRKVDARAKNLIATNLAPVQFYGAEVQGLDPA